MTIFNTCERYEKTQKLMLPKHQDWKEIPKDDINQINGYVMNMNYLREQITEIELMNDELTDTKQIELNLNNIEYLKTQIVDCAQQIKLIVNQTFNENNIKGVFTPSDIPEQEIKQDLTPEQKIKQNKELINNYNEILTHLRLSYCDIITNFYRMKDLRKITDYEEIIKVGKEYETTQREMLKTQTEINYCCEMLGKLYEKQERIKNYYNETVIKFNNMLNDWLNTEKGPLKTTFDFDLSEETFKNELLTKLFELPDEEQINKLNLLSLNNFKCLIQSFNTMEIFNKYSLKHCFYKLSFNVLNNFSFKTKTLNFAFFDLIRTLIVDIMKRLTKNELKLNLYHFTMSLNGYFADMNGINMNKIITMFEDYTTITDRETIFILKVLFKFISRNWQEIEPNLMGDLINKLFVQMFNNLHDTRRIYNLNQLIGVINKFNELFTIKQQQMKGLFNVKQLYFEIIKHYEEIINTSLINYLINPDFKENKNIEQIIKFVSAVEPTIKFEKVKKIKQQFNNYLNDMFNSCFIKLMLYIFNTKTNFMFETIINELIEEHRIKAEQQKNINKTIFGN